MAIAMGGSALPSDKRLAISANWGTFEARMPPLSSHKRA